MKELWKKILKNKLGSYIVSLTILVIFVGVILYIADIMK